jgi:hypothetical protein
MSAPSLKSWPPIVRDIVLDAARYYYQQMNEPFPVPDVLMERAVEEVNSAIDKRQREIYEEASDRWVTRWEDGKLDPEIKKVIEATYSKLRRAERGIRSRAGARKKPASQLDAEIAQALGSRRR